MSTFISTKFSARAMPYNVSDNIAIDTVQNTIYTHSEAMGIIALVAAGAISLMAILIVFMAFILKIVSGERRGNRGQRINLYPYIASLLLANTLQAIGTIMNVRWVILNGVFEGDYCTFQGAIKNTANLGTAFWSFVIALHTFNLLFLRARATRIGCWLTLTFVWTLILFLVTIGPFVIERMGAGTWKGRYFGVEGQWCWITKGYGTEQIFLEYFEEFLSAGLGFILYALILLRVRGNLTVVDGKWKFRWVSRKKAWQLAFGRDLIDSAMLRVASKVVWHPVAYSFLILPVAIARICTFKDTVHIPVWFTILSDAIFNLTGLVNALLVFFMSGTSPELDELPELSMPRSTEDGFVFGAKGGEKFRDNRSVRSVSVYSRESMTSSQAAAWKTGVTPFVLPPITAEEKRRAAQTQAQRPGSPPMGAPLARNISTGSITTAGVFQSAIKRTVNPSANGSGDGFTRSYQNWSPNPVQIPPQAVAGPSSGGRKIGVNVNNISMPLQHNRTTSQQMPEDVDEGSVSPAVTMPPKPLPASAHPRSATKARFSVGKPRQSFASPRYSVGNLLRSLTFQPNHTSKPGSVPEVPPVPPLPTNRLSVAPGQHGTPGNFLEMDMNEQAELVHVQRFHLKSIQNFTSSLMTKPRLAFLPGNGTSSEVPQPSADSFSSHNGTTEIPVIEARRTVANVDRLNKGELMPFPVSSGWTRE